MSTHENENVSRFGDGSEGAVTGLYNGIAVAIFGLLAIQLLFPSNIIFPVDRRTASCVCAVLVFVSRRFLFRQSVNIVEYIDFDVLLLLAAIMVINHVVVHLKETKACIAYIQSSIQKNPVRGFWMVSLSAAVISPWLTNDGVCLLFVEPILNAFADASPHATADKTVLAKSDSLYFLISLACSANIGSALTYTGNPQNMLVSQDALSVMSPMKFLAIQILPAISAWLITTCYIQRCWTKSRESLGGQDSSACCVIMTSYRPVAGPAFDMEASVQGGMGLKIENLDEEEGAGDAAATTALFSLAVCGHETALPAITSPVAKLFASGKGGMLSPSAGGAGSLSEAEVEAALSPRKQRELERIASTPKVSYYIRSPMPYIGLVLVGLMIVCIFVNVMSISALVCISALILVLSFVLGNHYSGQSIWNEEAIGHEALSSEERIEVISAFFEGLFASIDYNLLIIFLGLFVVCANTISTGLPKMMWASIVGPKPFRTPSSIFAISIFTIVISQLLGNVALIQMAVPEVSALDEDSKKYAWAVLSFVATVGGNLTITGSAANIIVAEKAQR